MVHAPVRGLAPDPGNGDHGAVGPRIESLRVPPIAFAHRGAMAHARENTIEAFGLALEMGASGLESDVWVTRDGHAVLDHDGEFGWWPRKRAVATVDRADLPGHVPTLVELFATCGVDYELSLDVKTDAAVEATVAVVRATAASTDPDLVRRVWLCHPDLDVVADWRRRYPDVRLVHSTRLRSIDGGPERHAATLAELGVDAVNMHRSDWTGGLTTLYHRFGVEAFGWDAQHERMLRELIDAGIDAVYSDFVDRMTTVMAEFHPPG